MSTPKSVVITGISGGIGQAIARTFKSHSWQVIGLDIMQSSDYPCDEFILCDIGDNSSVETAANLLAKKGISIICIVNNAAYQYEGMLHSTPENEWDKVINTNLKSIYLTTRHLMPHLEKNFSSIINISSVHAKATSRSIAAYAASKGGVSALTRAMALELADHGIRVNAILPGAIETPMLRKGLSRNHSPEESRNKLISSTPLKRIGSGSDVAELAFFLSEPKYSMNITGQEFICDGGVLAKLASE